MTDEQAAGQRAANDRLWGSGRLVRAYASRELRPVEIDILLRHRDALTGRVLELGCGAGRLTGFLADLSPSVQGIDLSAEMVAYSRRHYPRATFAQGDLRDTAMFAGAPYDAIVAGYNIVDVLSDDDRGQLLDHVAAALSPGGLFVMSSHNRSVAPHLGDPLRLSGLSPSETISSLMRMPRRLVNHRRLKRYERREATYAILNDPGHDYAVLHYYVTRDDQERQLDAHGFELLEALDLEGRPVAPGEAAAHCSELHYVARRTA